MNRYSLKINLKIINLKFCYNNIIFSNLCGNLKKINSFILLSNYNNVRVIVSFVNLIFLKII